MIDNATRLCFVCFGILVFSSSAYGEKKNLVKERPASISLKIDVLSAQQLKLLQIQERQQQNLQDIATSLKKVVPVETLHMNTYSYP